MDKYMQKAVQDYKAIEPPTMSRVAGWAMERRASELRLLDMLRRMHDPEFCPYKECDACALLAQYKDVKTH